MSNKRMEFDEKISHPIPTNRRTYLGLAKVSLLAPQGLAMRPQLLP